MLETAHAEWLIDHGFGHLVKLYSSHPEFLQDCKFDGNELACDEDVCQICQHKQVCEDYHRPLANALDRYFEIGEA